MSCRRRDLERAIARWFTGYSLKLMCDKALLVRDEAVPDPECWYRVLTNKDHVTRDNTIHFQALKTTAFSVTKQKAWTHELSGRLVRLAGDIVTEAEDRLTRIRKAYVDRGQSVPSKIAFVGVGFATAQELRAPDGCSVQREVVYTPLLEDSAHSDFVTFDTHTDSEVDPVRYWLIKVLRVVSPQNLGELVATSANASTQ